ncbi:MAG: hypothetical protein GY906_04790 [bacterium]|nr:hypothetical protein [bacterium]
MSDTFDRITRNVRRERDDCSIIAVAAICSVSYPAAETALRCCGRLQNDGAYDETILSAVKSFGYRVCPVTCRAKTLRSLARKYSLCHYLVATVDHAVAVIRGEIVDDQTDLARVETVWLIVRK